MSTKIQSTMIRIPITIHREMKIASAHRAESTIELIRKSWEAFKANEGRNLHKLQRESNQ